MKKVDLHIHTIPTICESTFEFNLEKMRDYIVSSEIDAVAITNHDLFDLDQFKQISSEISATVFPGIEINLENGHVLVISDGIDLDDFDKKTNSVSIKNNKIGDSITVQELKEIFGDLNKYLIIPHFDKKPAIKGDTYRRLEKFIDAGEVDSPKKFLRQIKDESKLTPVLFSDARFTEKMKSFPTRQTYVDCGDITLKTIKSCFKDKNKVALSMDEGNSLFQIFDNGQKISTGLNILLGERSSGKTHTLDKISETSTNVKYIEQFSLVQKDDEKDKRQFKDDLAKKKSLLSEEFLLEFKNVLSDVISVDLKRNDRQVESYLESLLKSADEIEKQDVFSKARLFNETKFKYSDEKVLGNLIGSVRQLIENIEYRSIIEKHVQLDSLKSLACELITMLWDKSYERKKKSYVNDIVTDIQGKLRLRTAATQVEDVDFYKVRLDIDKINKFSNIVNILHEEEIIYQENIQGYRVVAKKRPFKGPGEIKTISGQKVAFREAYKKYMEPYEYLVSLRDNDDLTPSEFYKYFTLIDYEILNKDGAKVSGGERSEFRLLQEVNDAQNYDILLVDEPESSFDNLFLKGEVNNILKEISRNMPVVVVTHNSTVGASIGADYILYAHKDIEEGAAVYKLYSGHPSDTELVSLEGGRKKNFDITMNSLEAGEGAYTERKCGYENIKN
ncbi:MAG: phosphotransferase [Candidatus Thiodiazotropha taylori]|nr:phosphotransferase [Candidatus Thiodiazotropha taylori]